MKLILGLLLGWMLVAADLRQLVSARAVAVSNSTNTPIYSPLEGATTVQVYIRPSSTAQIFTVTLPDGTTAEVPSGNSFTFRFGTTLKATDQLGTVQTATGAAVLQVIGFKETR